MNIIDRIKHKSNSDLQHMIDNPDKYEKEFIEAAKKLIKSRGDDYDQKKREESRKLQEEHLRLGKIKLNASKRYKENLHTNVKYAIYMAISIIVVNILNIPISSSTYEFYGISIPYLPEIIRNIFILGMIIGLRNGMLNLRFLLLIVFLIGIFIEVYRQIWIFNILGKDYLLPIRIYHIGLIQIGLKLLCLYYLFNTTTHKWIKSIYIKGNHEKVNKE